MTGVFIWDDQLLLLTQYHLRVKLMFKFGVQINTCLPYTVLISKLTDLSNLSLLPSSLDYLNCVVL